MLRQRYLEPVAAQGTFGELILEALGEDRNVARAARVIPVHVALSALSG
ncbi:hypothetical protein [Cryptosporangium sp. NPDC048952]